MNSLLKYISALATTTVILVAVLAEALTLPTADTTSPLPNNQGNTTKRDATIHCNSNQFDRNDYVAVWKQMATLLTADFLIPARLGIWEGNGTALTYVCNYNYYPFAAFETDWQNYMQVLDDRCGQTTGGWARSEASELSYGRDVYTGNPLECW